MKKIYLYIIALFSMMYTGYFPLKSIFFQEDKTEFTNIRVAKGLVGSEKSSELADQNNESELIIINASPDEGVIGVLSENVLDYPQDNVFDFDVRLNLSENWDVWLEYDLYGITHASGVTRSINDEMATGGIFVQTNSSWTHQREQLSRKQLKYGKNILRFSSKENSLQAYKVKNVKLCFKPSKGFSKSFVLFDYKALKSYGNLKYLRGFLNELDLTLFIDDQPIYSDNGLFETIIEGESGKAYKSKLTVKRKGVVLEEMDLTFDGENAPFQYSEKLFNQPRRTKTTIANSDWSLEMEGIRIAGDSGVVQAGKTISITALRFEDMPALGASLINVTAKAKGYRLLPHNSSFNGFLSLSIAIDTSKIPAGYSPRDIQTMYFDEGLKKWVKVNADTNRNSELWAHAKTNHFTDFINAIIKAPELPTSQAFTPTMLKDLKAANPLEGVNVIAPPQVNSDGSASINMPIEIPAGRQGMQPQLALQYSSESGNGWLGIGWNLNLPSIKVETRWGVPRYFPDVESEGYLLNGEELQWWDENDSIHPLVHRTFFVNRNTAGDRRYIARVEGGFNRIIRKGTSPSTYWWEVTDKTGVTHFYGKYSSDGAMNPNCVMMKDGKIAHWALAESRDLNGNFVRYEYQIDTHSGRYNDNSSGRQLYISKIIYTGNGTTNGKHTVEFNSETTPRPDTIINARYGFKEVTARRLSKIRVKYDNNLIRSYHLHYKVTKFNKSQICFILDAFGNDNVPFTADQTKLCGSFDASTQVTLPPGYKLHRFYYHDDDKIFDSPRTIEGDVYSASNVLSGFQSIKSVIQGNDFVTFDGLITNGFDQTILGASQGFSIGGGGRFYIGVGRKTNSKINSISGSYNYNWGNSRTRSTFMDIDGDGYPDRIVILNGNVYYQRIITNNGIPEIDFNLFPIPDLGQLGRQFSHTHGFGLQLMVGFNEKTSANGSVSHTRSTTTTPFYFSDVDGNGLPDFVSDGAVLLNTLTSQGNPNFTKSISDTIFFGGSCEYILNTGVINDSVGIAMEPENPGPFDQYMMNHQAVKMWRAPYSGLVDVSGSIYLIEDTSYARSQSRLTDGVIYTFQHNSNELINDTLFAGVYSSQNTGVSQIEVNKGDHFYFRIIPRENRTWDDVNWNPEIKYLSCSKTGSSWDPLDNSQKDANGKYIYRFISSDDFLFTGTQVLSMPYSGSIRIHGNIAVPLLSDTVKFEITDGDGTTYLNRFSNGSSSVNWTIDTTMIVAENDTLTFDLFANSSIAFETIQKNMIVDFLSIVDSNGSTSIDTTSELERIRLFPLFTAKIYENIIKPSKGYTLVSGTASATARLLHGANVTGDLVLTAKRNNEILGKKKITVNNGVITGDSVLNFNVSNSSSSHYFDFHTNNQALANALSSSQVKIQHGSSTTIANAGYYSNWPDTLQKFGNLYRGWGQFAYNGNRDLPIDQELLVISLHYSDSANIFSMDSAAIANMATNLSSTSTTGLLQNFNSDLDKLLDGKFHSMLPDPENVIWRGPGYLTSVSNNTLSNSLPRNQTSSIFYDSPVPSTTSSVDKKAVRKQTFQKTWTFGASVGPSSINVSGSHSRSTDFMRMDFVDVNGDRYPDAMGEVYVQYSTPQGGWFPYVSDHVTFHAGEKQSVNSNFSQTTGASIGGAPLSFIKNASSQSKGSEGTVSNKSLSDNVNANVAGGDNDTYYTLLDINGDGLPDKINSDGHVSINTGYSFEPYVDWGFEQVSTSGSMSYSSSLGVNVPLKEKGENSWSLGLGGGYSDNTTYRIPLDINGDGLTDLIAATSTAYTIHLNTGNGYIAAGGQSVDIRGQSINYNINGSGSATFGVIIPLPVFRIKIGGGGSFDLSFTRAFEKTQFIDVNNDGFVDFVYEEGTSATKVRLSKLGKQNLLTLVQTSVGSTYLIDYENMPSSKEMPQNKWVMSSLKVFDGFDQDGNDTTYYKYVYARPNYSRYERVFFGYDTVVSKQLDANGQIYRITLQRFHNDDFMFKGRKHYELITDALGNKYVEQITTYRKKEIMTGALVDEATAWCFGPFYPALYKEDVYFYEGQSSFQLHTQKEYEHGPFGNVVKYINYGDTADVSDDFYATINYDINLANYLVALPDKLQVLHGSTLLRERLAEYDMNTGRVIRIRANTGSGYADTRYGYDIYGNITRQQMPPNVNGQSLVYHYTYDPINNTYPIAVTDSVFSLTSSTNYDFRLGKPTSVTDVSGNTIEYSYNSIGRLKTIRGPREISNGAPFTLKFDYWDEGQIYFPYYFFPGIYTWSQIWARTSHYDEFNPGNFLTTVLHTDGVGKVIQTKKKATILGSDSLIVSGLLTYDDFGRVVNSYYPTTISLDIDSIFIGQMDAINPTRTVYDILDRPISVTHPDLTKDSTVFGFGNDRNNVKRFRTSVIDANGIVTHIFKDYRELNTTISAPLSAITSFKYNSLGELIESKDPENNITSYQYDNLGRMILRNHPDAGQTTYSFDNCGNLTAQATQNLINSSASISYDYEFNRLEKIEYPDNPENNVYYVYGASGNEKGRIVKSQDASGVHTYTYGVLGELIEKKSTSYVPVPGGDHYTFSTKWEYDSWNRIKTIIYPDNEIVQYSYDNSGQLISMIGDKLGQSYNYINSVQYNKFGKRTNLIYGNGVVSDYTYDPFSLRMSRLTTNDGSNLLQDFVYTFDNVGNITRIRNSANGASNLGGKFDYHYTYDSLYRLSTSNGVSTPTLGGNYPYAMAMEYSSSGNILSKTLNADKNILGSTPIVSYSNTYDYSNGPHKVSSVVDNLNGTPALNFAWDDNGNMVYQEVNTNSGVIQRTLCWDEENRLTSTKDENYMTHNIYDASGTRAWKIGATVNSMWISGTGWVAFGDLNLRTLYQSELMTLTDQGYTKHYFIEGQRIASKLGTGFVGVEGADISEGQTPIYRDLTELPDIMWRKVERDLACVGVDAKYCTYTPELAAMKNLPTTGTDPETDLYFYHGDHLGSSSFITDASAYPTQHLQYLPFGEDYIHQQNSSNYYSPFTFSAKERDVETELSYFGARYYEAGLSIWLSVDPMAHKYPHQSPFTYCSNNPVMFFDPNGEEDFTVDKNGHIKSVEGTQNNQGPDRLISLDENGNPTENILVVKPGLLQRFQSGTSSVVDKKGNVTNFPFTEMSSGRGGEIMELFNFLADNTNVEWSLNVVKGEQTNNFILSTSHSDENEPRGGANATRNADKLLLNIHSHPNKVWITDIGPTESSHFPGPGDLMLIDDILSKNPNVIFQIRNKGSNETIIR